ncbi:D-serine ammonia-lyase [Bradyrhizobium tropiciagri]|uniref:D-serine ammonia-lyase n=1 Tax=Bradyrhizobium tropiciagri TaxID=312253 RepID=UPI001BACF864|nr:D-serine ammonia-lyase [Bradyrhizobium tropiciagri]MBR0898983.1 D-serine ammonia-lyase [Bradyrhizobium tropiciagri]
MSSAADAVSRISQGISGVPAQVAAGRPTVWTNPARHDAHSALKQHQFGIEDVNAAAARWGRFAPLLVRLFPETARAGGIIDSDLAEVAMPLKSTLWEGRPGRLFVKMDHALPVTGCIKARGGFYEVLTHAESLAIKAGLISPGGDYGVLAGPPARQFFAERCLVVGSTGNLGFSVGVIGRALGFEVEVHMSGDAKTWKKDRLRRCGATVVEHEHDYGNAVASARRSAKVRSNCYFVDDENSIELFLGYAAAALDLKRQLAGAGITVSAAQPLVVFLPCGVGGAPGGITLGLKHLFGDAVHCIFVEPVAAPSMLVQLASGLEQSTSIYEIGLSNRTAADGLAVASASMLVARSVAQLVDAIVTVDDAELFRFAAQLHAGMSLRLEPSAAAGFAAVTPYSNSVGYAGRSPTAVVWTTGGALLPDIEFESILNRGRAIAAQPKVD